MARPWYAYPLLCCGWIALLLAFFRPMIGATSTAPGAFVAGAEGRLGVRPGGPLSQAGLEHGDYFLSAETVVAPAPGDDGWPWLAWKNGIPRSGEVRFRRGKEERTLQVRPAPPSLPVRFGWWLVGVLNAGLCVLALLLVWQRARDGSAVLLALVLMTAPVFSFPREPRLLALVLAGHFFAVFPSPAGNTPPPGNRFRRFMRSARLYVPFVIFGFLGSAVWDGGNPKGGRAIFDLLALGYAAWGVLQVLRRSRQFGTDAAPLYQTLLLASGAIFAATLIGIVQPVWQVGDQFVPANLLPAALFSLAVARLVFQLRALEVRLMARQTMQYLLARWTLGTLFLIPGFLLVWRLGQHSVSSSMRPGDVVGYLLWMALAALLLRRRTTVLGNLDRRFFRDVEARRLALLRLAHDIGELAHEAAIWEQLHGGLTRVLQPADLRVDPGEGAGGTAELAIPFRRRGRSYGTLLLGRKADDQSYTQEERELLEAVCVQTAAALENARLSAALLARQRAELAVRSAGVLAGQEEERRRLAADLHDEVLPELRQIAVQVERLRSCTPGPAPELAGLEQDLRGAMDSVREVMEALRPSALDMLGLSDALESYLRRSCARAEPPLTPSVRRQGPEPVLPAGPSLALYRICQEAINNAVRHARAARVGLEIETTDTEVQVAVWDDGRGLHPAPPAGGLPGTPAFSPVPAPPPPPPTQQVHAWKTPPGAPASPPGPAPARDEPPCLPPSLPNPPPPAEAEPAASPVAAGTGGHGLSNIRYRADLIGAHVRWEPRSGGGTRFLVRLPLTEAPAGNLA